MIRKKAPPKDSSSSGLYNFPDFSHKKHYASILLYVAERFGVPTAFSVIICLLVVWATRSLYNDVLLPVSSRHLQFIESVETSMKAQERALKVVADNQKETEKLYRENREIFKRIQINTSLPDVLKPTSP